MLQQKPSEMTQEERGELSRRARRSIATKRRAERAPARFWAKVQKTEGCWNWTGLQSSYGYGRFTYTTQDGSHHNVRAHRYSWGLANGQEPPADMEVDHRCHNRLCVNPDHLRLATSKQNKENRNGASRISKSGVRGVWWNSSKRKWLAVVGHNKQQIRVGEFDSIEEADAAVSAKRRELFTHSEMDRIR